MVGNEKVVRCMLCGNLTALTRDHIFPRCLFPKPLPTNLPTMPACEKCNNDLSKDEELFRVFLTSGMAYESIQGKKVWDKSIRPDLQGKRPHLKSLIKSMAKLEQYKVDGGIFLIGTLSFDRETINRVFQKIARGLYFLDSGDYLPTEAEILIRYYDEYPEILSAQMKDAIHKSKRYDLGDGVVSYWHNIVKDRPEESMTWLRFYEDKIFLIVTTTENGESTAD